MPTILENSENQVTNNTDSISIDSLNNSIIENVLNHELYDDSTQIVTTAQTLNVNNNLPQEKSDYFNTFMPILTLFLGFILTKGYDFAVSKFKMKSSAKQWLENFIQLKTPLDQQIIDIKEYLPQFDGTNFELKDPKFSLFLNCEVLKSLDNKVLVPYFSKGFGKMPYKEAVVLTGELKNLVNIIEHDSSNYVQSYKNMQSEISTHITLFNEVFNLFRVKWMEYGTFVEINYKKGSAEFLEFVKMGQLMTEYIHPHVDDGEFDLFLLGREYVKPFFEATYTDKSNPILNDVIIYLNKCDQHIKAIKMEQKYLKIRLEKIQKSYIDTQLSMAKKFEINKIKNA